MIPALQHTGVRELDKCQLPKTSPLYKLVTLSQCVIQLLHLKEQALHRKIFPSFSTPDQEKKPQTKPQRQNVSSYAEGPPDLAVVVQTEAVWLVGSPPAGSPVRADAPTVSTHLSYGTDPVWDPCITEKSAEIAQGY